MVDRNHKNDAIRTSLILWERSHPTGQRDRGQPRPGSAAVQHRRVGLQRDLQGGEKSPGPWTVGRASARQDGAEYVRWSLPPTGTGLTKQTSSSNDKRSAIDYVPEVMGTSTTPSQECQALSGGVPEEGGHRLQRPLTAAGQSRQRSSDRYQTK